MTWPHNTVTVHIVWAGAKTDSHSSVKSLMWQPPLGVHYLLGVTTVLSLLLFPRHQWHNRNPLYARAERHTRWHQTAGRELLPWTQVVECTCLFAVKSPSYSNNVIVCGGNSEFLFLWSSDWTLWDLIKKIISELSQTNFKLSAFNDSILLPFWFTKDCKWLQTWYLSLKQPFQKQSDHNFIAHR